MVRVGIVGHRGYSGAELIRILERHSGIEILLLEHRDGFATPAICGSAAPARIPCTAEAVQSEQLSLVFLATPPAVSMDLAPVMLAAGARVVDLSGAFRLGAPDTY